MVVNIEHLREDDAALGDDIDTSVDFLGEFEGDLESLRE